MYVSFRAVNAEDDEGRYSGGKNRTLESHEIKVYPNSGQGVIIHADCAVDTTNGERGGNVTTIIRYLQMSLDVSDLQKILEAAIMAHAVTIPGSQRVAEAAELLEKALSEMRVSR